MDASTALPGESARLVWAIEAAKGGSRDAVHYLYCLYADMVYGYVASIVRDQHEAEDVTQAVFTKLMVRIGRYEPRGLPFSQWLLCVARKAALDHLRRGRAVPVGEAHAAETTPNVVVLRRVKGLSPPATADGMGSSEAVVHGLHRRRRQALKVALAARGVRPALRPVS